ncbi:prepilin peptidase [Extibacter muris]|uniref:Prepilin peptidase n=1 Tax=Extibacter muris TaxID=1796622 RepID=A0A4R4FJ81_9FIRM|nr:A24 family peptidase [Extibacter muris]MCU0078612.1 A24 family peptidase [Extibacter muris]TDA22883.1 prepilin peptidase [Extibacter muris]
MICTVTAAAAGAAVFRIIERCCTRGGRALNGSLHAWLCRASGAAAILYCLHRYEGTGACLTMFGFLCILAAVTLTDLYHREIPDICWAAAMILAFLSVWTLPGLSVWERAAGSLCVSVPFLVIALIVPGSFGGGDIKLMAACGLFLGWKVTAVSAAAAVLTAGGSIVYGMVAGRRKIGDVIAFGPFLCIGMLVGIIWGNRVIEWYVS